MCVGVYVCMYICTYVCMYIMCVMCEQFVEVYIQYVRTCVACVYYSMCADAYYCIGRCFHKLCICRMPAPLRCLISAPVLLNKCPCSLT